MKQLYVRFVMQTNGTITFNDSTYLPTVRPIAARTCRLRGRPKLWSELCLLFIGEVRSFKIPIDSVPPLSRTRVTRVLTIAPGIGSVGWGSNRSKCDRERPLIRSTSKQLYPAAWMS